MFHWGGKGQECEISPGYAKTALLSDFGLLRPFFACVGDLGVNRG